MVVKSRWLSGNFGRWWHEITTNKKGGQTSKRFGIQKVTSKEEFSTASLDITHKNRKVPENLHFAIYACESWSNG